MKAMILAAGQGTRVRPLTYTVPKPMIPLIRKPVMESLIEHLASFGVEDIVINTSHLSSVIENYFSDGKRFGVNIGYSFEGEIVDGEVRAEAVGSAGGMKKIQEHSGFFDDTFVVLCGDAFVDLDLDKVLQFHKSRNSMATIVMRDVPRSEVAKYGVVQTDESGRILRFQEKPDEREAVSTTINTGIYLFEPEIFNHIPKACVYDIGGELFPKLVEQNIPFYGVTSEFQWLDIGSIPDYWAVSREVVSGKLDGYELPGREIMPGVRVGINVNVPWDEIEITCPVYIGGSSQIQPGAKIIGPTIIGQSCVIESGAMVKECIVDDYKRIRRNTEIRQTILFGDHCISPSGFAELLVESTSNNIACDARMPVECDNQAMSLLANAKSY